MDMENLKEKKGDSGKSVICLPFVYFKGKNDKKMLQLNYFFSDLLWLYTSATEVVVVMKEKGLKDPSRPF